MCLRWSSRVLQASKVPILQEVEGIEPFILTRDPNPPGQKERILLSVTASTSILAAPLQWQQLGEV